MEYKNPAIFIVIGNDRILSKITELRRISDMRRIGLLVLMICLLLTGCGGNNAASQQSEDISTQQSGEAAPETEQPSGQIAQTVDLFHVAKVQTVQFQEPEEGYTEHSVSYKVLGKKIYMLRIEIAGEKPGSRLCVQSYDTESAETQQLFIVPQIPEHENSMIFSADLTAGMELSLKMRNTDSENAFFLVRMDLEGNILEVTDPFPQEDSYPWNRDFWDATKVFVLDDGRMLLCKNNMEEETTRLNWYQEDTGEGELLGTLNSGFVNTMMLGEDGKYYYSDGGSLYRWDAEKNVSENLFRMYQNGIEHGADTAGLIQNEKGELLFCCMQSGKAVIYILTDQEDPDMEHIRLCSLWGEAGISYFQRLAATFTQNGGEIPIKLELESRQEYWDDYRTRVMAEMMSGKGPDILFVTQEDMILMQEKGMVCDLSDMIAQETKEVMIPGVLELGTVNGELVGLVPEVSFVTLGTSNKVWPESGWNAEELVNAVKAADLEGCPFTQMGVGLDGGSILFAVFLQDPAETPFLDLEQGKANFDCEEFTDMLELCKQFGDQRSWEDKMREQLSLDERNRLLREGKTAGEILYLYGGLDAYSSIAERYGDEGHIVGFPVESGSGCYVDSYSYGYLVVNAQTKYKDEICKFFAQILDYDNQFETNGGTVRMDVIRNSVEYDEWLQKDVMLRSNDKDRPMHMQIEVKPDGTSYLEEYLAFVENCEPTPYWPQDIRSIIGEEISPFFEGKKSAAEVADVIQRRVQLYLDETR